MNSFENNIISLYGEKGRQWLIDLSWMIKEISKRWNLSNLKPIRHLSHNYVLSGFQDHQKIILKIGFDRDDLAREGQALSIFGNYGAVKLLDQSKNALLLEHAMPGDSLNSLKEDSIQIACNVMQKLHKAPLPNKSVFPHIIDVLSVLDEDWNLPIDYLKKARSLKNELLKIPMKTVLLHGDLHYENILKNRNDWVAIDPKGIIGYEINEIWAFIMNIEKDIEFVSNFFKLDIQFLRQWYFVHLVLVSINCVKNKTKSKIFLDLVSNIYKLI